MNRRGVHNTKIMDAWERSGNDLDKAASLCDLKPSTMQKRLYALGISPYPKLVDNETVLRVWGECNRHTETAAEKLGMHPNSVRYRLTECLGIKLSNGPRGGRRPVATDEQVIAACEKAPTLHAAAELLGYSTRSTLTKRLAKIRAQGAA